MEMAPTGTVSPRSLPTDCGAREGEMPDSQDSLDSPHSRSLSPTASAPLGSALTASERTTMESFQTLDYDICENMLYREREAGYSQRDRLQRTRQRATGSAPYCTSRRVTIGSCKSNTGR